MLATILKAAVSSTSDYPLLHNTICSVSRHWRAVAVASPDLWTDIRVAIRPKWAQESWFTPRAELPSMNTAIAWFNRSGSCLLDFHLNILHGADVDTLNRLTPILFHHAHRLESLSIHFSLPGVVKKLMTFLCKDEGNTVHLRRLDLRIDNKMHVTRSGFDTIYWNGGQLLTSLSISHFPFQLTMPIHQLTSLSHGCTENSEPVSCHVYILPIFDDSCSQQSPS